MHADGALAEPDKSFEQEAASPGAEIGLIEETEGIGWCI